MRFPMPRLALGGLILGGLLAIGGLALAQINIGSQGFFGNEVIEIAQGGPGGPSTFGTVGRISNGRSNAYFSAFPTASFTIGGANPTGTTVSTVGVASGGVLLFNVTNGTAITITLPANPVIDGTIIGICNVTAAAWATNAVTVSANTSQTIVGTAATQTLTTLAASTCNKWIWSQANADWFVMVGG
jgi:hypothetical protein